MIGENNSAYTAATRRIEVIVDRHYESWTGILNAFNDTP
jgi:hypothetical protein